MSEMTALAESLKERFPQAVSEISEFRGDVTAVVDRKAIAEVCQYCHDTPGFEFNLLSDICGIDYLGQTPRFGIAYVMYSISCNQTLRLKVLVPEEDPVLPTVTGVWPSANWQEREVWDMFGIKFDGHPDMRRILLPFDWTGHPLRKDYPLGYEEVQFSFNHERVQANKPAPKE